MDQFPPLLRFSEFPEFNESSAPLRENSSKVLSIKHLNCKDHEMTVIGLNKIVRK